MRWSSPATTLWSGRQVGGHRGDDQVAQPRFDDGAAGRVRVGRGPGGGQPPPPRRRVVGARWLPLTSTSTWMRRTWAARATATSLRQAAGAGMPSRPRWWRPAAFAPPAYSARRPLPSRRFPGRRARPWPGSPPTQVDAEVRDLRITDRASHPEERPRPRRGRSPGRCPAAPREPLLVVGDRVPGRNVVRGAPRAAALQRFGSLRLYPADREADALQPGLAHDGRSAAGSGDVPTRCRSAASSAAGRMPPRPVTPRRTDPVRPRSGPA